MEWTQTAVLHDAGGSGRTEVVNEVIKLGATTSVFAGSCGTPLHQDAILMDMWKLM